jgi:DNA-binding MarR family transcriptional regulator
LTKTTSDPPTSLLFDVFALYQSVGRMLAAYMIESPLNPAEYAFYSAIFETESITPSALAARLGMPLTTVMDHLARYEARGHVSRMVDPTDRRATLVVLTAKGVEAHRAANTMFQQAYDAFDTALGKNEIEAQRALAEVRAAVETAARAAPHGRTRSARRRAGAAPHQVRIP